MIFKTWLTDLTKIQGVVNSIKSIELWVNGATGLLNPNTVNNLSSAINGLTLQQAQLALSTRNLTQEQMNQVFVQAGLIASEDKIQAELIQSALAQAGLSAENQKAVLEKLKLINVTSGEIIATKACTKEELLNALATKGVTGANAEAIISALGLSGANGTATISFGLLTASIWTNIKALVTWLATNPVGWCVLAAAAIFGTVKAFDALTVSFDEAVEKTKSSKEELDQLTSEINDLNNELKITKDRIEELLEKANSGTISLLEEEELNNLREQNDELQREIALKEKLAEIDAKEAAENAAYSLTYRTDDDHWDDEYNATDRIDKLQSYVDSANYYQEKIAEVNQQILDIEESATDGTYKNDSVYKDLINKQQKYQDGLQKTEELISSVYKELSTEDDSLYYNGKPIEGYEDLIDRLDTVYLAVELYLNDGDIEDTTEKYIGTIKNKLIESGLSEEITNAVVDGFSEEELTSIMSSESIDWSQCLGLDDATAVIENIKEQLASVGNTDEPPTLSISETIDQLNTQLKPAFDSLKSAYQDIFTDDGKFALNSIDILSTCDSIKSKLDDMAELGLDIDYSSYEDFVRVLRNSESTEQNVKDAFDSLAASITSAGLSGAEDFETLKTALEDLGVVNEELVAFEALTSNTEALKEAGLDLASATEEQINAFANEMVSAENVSEAIAMLTFQKELCGLQDMNTAGEVANLLTLAENAGYTGEVIEHLTELEQIYQQVASGTLTPGQLDAKLARAEELQGLIKDSAGKINYEPKVDFNGAGGKKAASKAGKEAADAYLEAFEKELSELDDLKSRGKITEKQYLDALRKLYVKYFNQKKKYLKEYEKYEHKYLDGMKSLYESAFSYITKQIDKRIDAINAEKDATISALEAQRDAELAEIEAKKEQHENEIESIEKEISAKEKEIKAMQDANEERKRAIDLQKAEYELQRMQNQKTSLVYKDKQMSYQADTSGIRDAKQEVEDAKLEIDISKIEKEIDLLEEEKDKLQELIDKLDKEAEKVNDYYDKLIAKEEQRYDAMIKGMEDYKSQFEELSELFENAQMEAALSELGINMEALLNGSQEEFEKLKTAYIGILADMSRGNDEVIGQLSRLAGVNAESVSYLEATKGAFENLGGVTLEGLENSVDGVADSASGLTTSAGEASDAVGSIQESVNSTSQSITPLNEELEKLNKLITELTALLNNIEFPEIGDEGYAQKLSDIALAFGKIAVKCAEFQKIDFSSIIGTGASVTGGNGDPLSGGNSSDTQGQTGTGFMGLASAISNAVETISGQMDNLQTALQVGNDAFEEQIKKIQEEYIPAWEELQTRLAEIIGVGGGDGENRGEGNKTSGGKDGGSESGGNGGSIIDIMQTGGEEVAARLEDPWLKAFNDFATDGDNSIQSICDKIIEIVTEMARIIQEQCAAAANALNALVETASTSLSSVGGSVSGNTVSVTPHAEGTVGKAFAKGTGNYKGLAHDEKNAVRSEYGQPELTVYPDGKAELTTEPTMGALPKGTVIFNEEQTRQIMKNKGEVIGNAYGEGTEPVIPLSMKSLPYFMTDPSYRMMEMFMENMEKKGVMFMNSAKDLSEAAQNINNLSSVISNNNNTMNRNVNVDVGGIHVHGVQNPEDFSDIVSMRAHNRILQEMKKY